MRDVVEFGDGAVEDALRGQALVLQIVDGDGLLLVVGRVAEDGDGDGEQRRDGDDGGDNHVGGRGRRSSHLNKFQSLIHYVGFCPSEYPSDSFSVFRSRTFHHLISARLGTIQKIRIGEQIAIQARVRREHEPP